MTRFEAYTKFLQDRNDTMVMLGALAVLIVIGYYLVRHYVRKYQNRVQAVVPLYRDDECVQLPKHPTYYKTVFRWVGSEGKSKNH